MAERGPLGGEEEDAEAVEERIEEVTDEPGRRSVLKLFWAAGGALALSAVFPIRSLGPAPERALLTTAWRPGARLVDEEGRPVRVDTLEVGGTLTAFPEGAAARRRLPGGAGPGGGRRHQAPPRPGGLGAPGLHRLLQDLPPRGLPRRAVPGRHPRAALPVPPVDLRRPRRRPPPASAPPPARCPSSPWPSTARASCRPGRLRRARGPRLLEPGLMSRRRRSPAACSAGSTSASAPPTSPARPSTRSSPTTGRS